jgi:hypothetical protein
MENQIMITNDIKLVIERDMLANLVSGLEIE